MLHKFHRLVELLPKASLKWENILFGLHVLSLSATLAILDSSLTLEQPHRNPLTLTITYITRACKDVHERKRNK